MPSAVDLDNLIERQRFNIWPFRQGDDRWLTKRMTSAVCTPVGLIWSTGGRACILGKAQLEFNYAWQEMARNGTHAPVTQSSSLCEASEILGMGVLRFWKKGKTKSKNPFTSFFIDCLKRSFCSNDTNNNKLLNNLTLILEENQLLKDCLNGASIFSFVFRSEQKIPSDRNDQQPGSILIELIGFNFIRFSLSTVNEFGNSFHGDYRMELRQQQADLYVIQKQANTAYRRVFEEVVFYPTMQCALTEKPNRVENRSSLAPSSPLTTFSSVLHGATSTYMISELKETEINIFRNRIESSSSSSSSSLSTLDKLLRPFDQMSQAVRSIDQCLLVETGPRQKRLLKAIKQH
ncbi:hypothetical protein T4B_1741 [Trichinella pseudospiralis]|uniref:Uncharacterized protein n=1 Tax=Trichinella pseudospiralis TaxID=6337 RepID=A0A0V1IQ73_TRIPS|nr:hypothetical protein T4B_1741 [Trichinella pseudospiralis]